MNQVQLPETYKKFLLKYNGGMVVYDYQDEFIQTQADFEIFKKESVYILSIEEIAEKYTTMVSLAVQRGNQIHPYPFIPFCTLPHGRFLLFINLHEYQQESPVFIGSHNKSEKFWNKVSVDFPDFLESYIDKNGHPEFADEDLNENAYHFFQKHGNKKDVRKNTNPLSELSVSERAHYYYEQALQFNKQDKFYESWELISKAINEEPENTFYYFFRAEILNSTKQFRAALIDYDVALQFEPGNSFYWCCRAEVLTQLNLLEQGLNDCTRALQIDEKSTLAYFLRKQIYLKMGETELASKDQKSIDELERI
jgi:hypothetical protein